MPKNKQILIRDSDLMNRAAMKAILKSKVVLNKMTKVSDEIDTELLFLKTKYGHIEKFQSIIKLLNQYKQQATIHNRKKRQVFKFRSQQWLNQIIRNDLSTGFDSEVKKTPRKKRTLGGIRKSSDPQQKIF